MHKNLLVASNDWSGYLDFIKETIASHERKVDYFTTWGIADLHQIRAHCTDQETINKTITLLDEALLEQQSDQFNMTEVRTILRFKRDISRKSDDPVVKAVGEAQYNVVIAIQDQYYEMLEQQSKTSNQQ